MKPRPYGSFARAVTRIRERVGEHQCAMLVRRSPALIKKWCDPDHPCLPNLRQSVALDMAFVRAALGEPPIFGAYGGKLEQTAPEVAAEAFDPVRFTLMIQTTAADLARCIMEAVDSFKSRYDPLPLAQRREILGIIEELEAQLKRLQRLMTLAER